MEQFSILIFPYPEDGKRPSAELHMETSLRFEAFCAENEKLMNAFHGYCACRASDSGEQGELCKFRVWDGAHEDFVSCSEEEIIAVQLKYWKDTGVTVKEVRYRGGIYTQFGIPDELDFVWLRGNTETGPAAEYLFVDGPVPCVGDDEPFEVAGSGFAVVEANKNMMYAGKYWFESDPCTVTNSEWDPELDRLVDHAETYTHSFTLNLFLETDGEDLTFSVLSCGRLYPKISHRDEQVAFYAAPDECSDQTDWEDASGDIVFENVGNKYYYILTDDTPDSMKKFGVVVFTPPEKPALPDQKSAQRLYEAYIHALYAAFAATDGYKAEGYVFKRADAESMLCAQTEDFTLYGEFFVPSPDDAFTHDSFRYFNISDHDFGNSDHFVIRRVAFSKGSSAQVAFYPKRGDSVLQKLCPFNAFEPNDFEIEVNDGEQYRSSFGELNKRGFFSQEHLPDTVRFDWRFSAFVQHIEVYKKIRRAILNVSMRQFVRDLTGILPELSAGEMEKLLYGNDLEPDPDVISLVMELQARFNDTGRIPNIALIGEAGTGKSTMAGKIARVLFGKNLLEVSPADLKAPYVGQTKYETLQRLAEAAKNEQIFFIDEAYTLMQDQFGQEAVSLLLPLMTGNQNVRKLEARIGKTTLSVDFANGAVICREDNSSPIAASFPPGVPPIWIAGYEDDIRLMLQENQGLFRRFRRVTLKTPTTSKLYEELLKRTRLLIQTGKDGSAVGDKGRILLNLFEKKADLIKKFFQWGAQPQNSKYFASHAGVENFLDRCLYGINFSSGRSGEDIAGEMEDIISQIKRDIKTQLDTLRRKGGRGGAGRVEDGDRVEMVTDIKTRFKDLIGCKSQIRSMESIIEMLLHKSVYDGRAMTVSKGVLLLGRPGVGKTFIARAMAGELQARFEAEAPDKRMGFMSLSAPELTAKDPGFIRSVFEKAEEYDACVIFIDEVDAIAKRRFQNNCYSHFIELIKQMDGIEQRSNVFVLAATNAPEFLDPAFTRAGRIDEKLTFDLPGRADRLELAKQSLEKRCRKLPMFDLEENGAGVDDLAEKLAAMTPGYTPGEIENIVNTAFILYYQEEEKKKEEQSSPRVLGTKDLMDCLYRYLYEALERKRIGALRPKGDESFNVDRNNESRSATAVHEVGHALVEVLRGQEPFEKITALPRGSALGYVTPKQNPVLTKADFENRIRSIMGGRIAEEIVYGADNISVGASSDIQYATKLARYMVEEVGFASEFGFMSLKESTARYLGEDRYICSEAFRKQSDEAVNALLKKLYLETKGMLADKRELIIAFAKQVFERETMTGQEFLRLYRETLNG